MALTSFCFCDLSRFFITFTDGCIMSLLNSPTFLCRVKLSTENTYPFVVFMATKCLSLMRREVKLTSGHGILAKLSL